MDGDSASNLLRNFLVRHGVRSRKKFNLYIYTSEAKGEWHSKSISTNYLKGE